MNWSFQELVAWADKIEKRYLDHYAKYGFSFYPQEFRVVDYHGMLSTTSYLGLPFHYPHWSFGKAYELTRTRYKYGVQGLPYEIVINSNPAIAYLMNQNMLVAQILTMSHVYGHNDFFKNNHYFKNTDTGNIVERFRLHAERIKEYVADPTIGYKKVERIVDAAHAIAFQIRRNIGSVELTAQEEKKRMIEESKPKRGRWFHLAPKKKTELPDITRVPIRPEEDILRFIIKYQPILQDWERDVLEIVAQRSDYFLPQMITQIMNEGWATFWHYKVGREIGLTQGQLLDLHRMHAAVIVQAPYRPVNPYKLGFLMWNNIFDRYENAGEEISSGGRGFETIFRIRATERDNSFVRNFATKKVLEEMNLLEYGPRTDRKIEVKAVARSEDESWKNVRDALAASCGISRLPRIVVVDANYRGRNELLLFHCYEGRELKDDDAVATLKYIWNLWNKRVVLITVIHKDDLVPQCWVYEIEGKKNDPKIKSEKHCDKTGCPVYKYTVDGKIEI